MVQLGLYRWLLLLRCEFVTLNWHVVRVYIVGGAHALDISAWKGLYICNVVGLFPVISGVIFGFPA